MKNLSLFVIAILLSLPAIPQTATRNYQVKGQMVNKISGEGIPYATITLKNDSVKIKKMVACGPSGQFSIDVDKPLTYNLIVSAIGYKEFSMAVPLSEDKTDLGKLQMEESTLTKEVVVSAQKPLVKLDLDKIIYSIESDPESQTTNGFEMLRKIPLVTVDAEENVTVNGQTNFKVLVNGKSSTMMSSNFKDVLKSLPASSIKDIEVITNPSSKYDAEGVGGILNIITAKKTFSGYNGNVNLGINSRGGYNGSLYLATKINKFSLGARFYGSQMIQPRSESHVNSEYFNNSQYRYRNSDGSSNYKGYGGGFSGEASYEIDSLNLISLSFWSYGGAYNSSSNSVTDYLDELNAVSRYYTSETSSKQGYSYLSGNIDYQKTFKKPDKSLTFSYMIDNEPNKSRYTSNINGLINYPTYNQRSDNDAVGREQTLQVDYYDPITKTHQVEGGLKFILRQNKSTSEVYRNDTLSGKNSNELDYNQYILGTYAGYVLKLKKFGIRTGLRLERTWNDGVSKVQNVNTDFTNRLFNLIPYITFSFMPTKSQTFRLSYTQRLSRPGIWYLNPYVNNIDSLNISYGNPDLKSEVSHSFELGYTYFTPKINISASSNASIVNNSIESISKVQPNGGTVTTYMNIGNNQRYGLNLYVNYRPNQKISLYLNGSGNYSILETNNGYPISNKGFTYNLFLNGRITLWKNGSVSLYGGMYSPSIMLQGKSSSYYYTSFSVSQYLLKRKLMMTLSASDPFWYRKKYTSVSNDITFISHSEYTQLAQMFRFTLSYNFGKMDLQVQKAKRGIQNDDLKGGGGNQGEKAQ